MITWEIYNEKEHKEIDQWILQRYSSNSGLINEFALFYEPLSKIVKWYHDNPNQMSNLFDLILVAREKNKIIGFIIINYFTENNKKTIGINPIVVEPNLIGIGYGTKMIKDIISKKGKIFDMDPNDLYVTVSVNNDMANKMFQALSFKIVGYSPNNDFIYYTYDLR
ncbi:MAG: GNAT family N-acetyltransferase [Acholeplasmataceae bacterium]